MTDVTRHLTVPARPLAPDSIAAQHAVPDPPASSAPPNGPWKPQSPNFKEAARFLDQHSSIVSGPKLDPADRYLYDSRPLDERSPEERVAERKRRAETAHALGLRISDEERRLLGLG